MGVPTHYQNDGSFLYLLTPVFSPPSADCVHRWLLHDDTDTSAEPLPVGSVSHVKPVLDQQNHGIHDNLNAKKNAFHDKISGPEEKSKPTPLSQIGFRDPASVGGGQQVTLLSIEIQAESRGDLRPDPRYDAINVIVLVIQEDDDSALEVFVLCRSNIEPCQRYECF
ncbi:DNA polymerase zeta catalytic subunit [Vitis vinifera]|uniref:DNA polymerase zeta catalytic subunit n=1 Tax=Vitis vinifera TaxID=29760 RepID=A0A438KBZ2_VITVI|nr:DNA polymerase zeta catalytic subunit [Vitis vinifera]